MSAFTFAWAEEETFGASGAAPVVRIAKEDKSYLLARELEEISIKTAGTAIK